MDSEAAGKSYGGCTGPDSLYVKLVASDGQEFIVKRELALISGTITAMLAFPYEEDETQVVVLKDITSRDLELVCLFMYYKKYYLGRDTAPDFDIPEKDALSLLMTANFLAC